MLDRFRLGPITKDMFDNVVSDALFSFSATSMAERQVATDMIGDIIARQRQTELELLPEGEEAFSINGYCAICGQQESLITSFMYANPTPVNGRIIPNWREHLGCSLGFPNRVRASMHFAQTVPVIALSDRIYISERVTPLYRWLSSRYHFVEGSEFLGPSLSGGSLINGVRHEDLCKLSYPDASFDVAMSFDVMEHVSDFEAALNELARVLKPGGKLIMQAPTMPDTYETSIRARLLADGSIEHILPAEYHGNPVDPENGSLCFRYLGVDTLDKMREAGFRSAHLVQYWSLKYGYFGGSQVLFYAIR